MFYLGTLLQLIYNWSKGVIIVTFKQWINDFDTVPDDVRHIVLRPDFPEEDRYLDMLAYIEQTSVNSKVFLCLLNLYLIDVVVK